MTMIIKQETTENYKVTLAVENNLYIVRQSKPDGIGYRDRKEYKSTDKKKANAAYNRYKREA